MARLGCVLIALLLSGCSKSGSTLSPGAAVTITPTSGKAWLIAKTEAEWTLAQKRIDDRDARLNDLVADSLVHLIDYPASAIVRKVDGEFIQMDVDVVDEQGIVQQYRGYVRADSVVCTHAIPKDLEKVHAYREKVAAEFASAAREDDIAAHRIARNPAKPGSGVVIRGKHGLSWIIDAKRRPAGQPVATDDRVLVDDPKRGVLVSTDDELAHVVVDLADDGAAPQMVDGFVELAMVILETDTEPVSAALKEAVEKSATQAKAAAESAAKAKHDAIPEPPRLIYFVSFETGLRHARGCKEFLKGRGYMCEIDEGTPCPICGGGSKQPTEGK